MCYNNFGGGDMDGKSIYEMIKQAYFKNPKLPYGFQDINYAGKRDVLYNFCDEHKSKVTKDELGIRLVEMIRNVLVNRKTRQELKEYIEKNKIYRYYEHITPYLHHYIEKDLIDISELYHLAISLATKSSRVESVKLGILLLGIFQDETAESIIQVLGLHSEFTLYALEAMLYCESHNEYIKDFLKSTIGYGKLVALFEYEPITNQEKRWVLEEGCKNDLVPNLSAEACLNKAECVTYYSEIKYTSKNFSSYSYLIAYGLELEGPSKFHRSYELIESYMNVANVFMNQFIDLAAIVVIHQSVSTLLEQQDQKKDSIWNKERKIKILNECVAILESKNYSRIILEELRSSKQKITLIIKCMEYFNIHPDFSLFQRVLRSSPFDLDVMEYVLIRNFSYYVENIYCEVVPKISPEIFEGQLEVIAEQSLVENNREDLWLYYLLKMDKSTMVDHEKFYIQCLHARYHMVRREAIKKLKVMREYWSDDVESVLSQLYEVEPDMTAKVMISGIIAAPHKQVLKRCTIKKMVDLQQTDIKRKQSDQSILKTYIAGTHYHESQNFHVKEGDIVYFVQDKENYFDKSTILVVDCNGMILGYIPKKDNELISLLLNRGDLIYGVMLSQIEYGNKAKLEILLQSVMA